VEFASWKPAKLPPPRTTLPLLRNPGGLRFSVFEFQSPDLSDIAQHSSRFPLRPLPPVHSTPLAMDFSKLQDQVSNLTLYDLKAGVRKMQNGMLSSLMYIRVAIPSD
jgi:hypothetical protein